MFTKIHHLMWQDQKFKELSDHGKLIFIYLCTTPHRNMLGLYYLPMAYGSEDLGMDIQQYKEGFNELLSKGFIEHDETVKMVFIKNFLKHNAMENGNQIKAAIKVLDALPITGLEQLLLQRIEQLGKGYMEPLAKQLKKRLGKGYSKQEEVEEEVKEEVDCKTEEDDLSNLIKYYESIVGKDVTPNQTDKLKEFMISGKTNREIKDAIDKTKDAEKPCWKYFENTMLYYTDNKPKKESKWNLNF